MTKLQLRKLWWFTTLTFDPRHHCIACGRVIRWKLQTCFVCNRVVLGQDFALTHRRFLYFK